MIIRIDKNENYSVMSNFALNDAGLSLKAKGLWAFIMTKPDNWKINYRGLQTQLKEGRDAILTALAELEECGYLTRGVVRSKDGKFETGDAVLYEQPCTDNPSTDNTDTKVSTVEVSTELDIIQKVKKPEDPEVGHLIQYWTRTFGYPPKSLAADKRCAVKLIKAYPIDDIHQVLQYAHQIQGQPYAPVVANLQNLWFKWEQLGAHYLRNQNTANNLTVDIKE